MNMPDINRITEAFGWALVHFLWQGAAVAMLLWAALWIARRRPPEVRYLAAGIAMLLMLAITAASLWREFATAAPPHQPAVAPVAKSAIPESATVPRARESNRAVRESVPASGSIAGPGSDPSTRSGVRLPEAAEPATGGSREPAAGGIRPWMPWVVAAWGLGVLALSVRLVAGWCIVRRWREGGDSPGREWASRFDQICARVGLRRAVTLLSSAAVPVPMVIGWLKPVVLIPASLFAGLTPQQLEAILAHELAHIRRHDFLINLLQNLVETLFFYHPAVWWVSAQLRKEREHCCDDLAASLCGGAVDYAKALAALEESRAIGGMPMGSAVSATGGSLLARIRRLIGSPEEKTTSWPLGFIAGMVVVLITSLSLIDAARSDSEVDPAGGRKSNDRGEVKPVVRSYRGMDQSLLRRWQRLEGRETPISEESLSGLREAIRRCLSGELGGGASFTDRQARVLESFANWHAGRAEHPAAELARMLGELLAVHGEPIQLAFNETPTPGRRFDPQAAGGAEGFGPAGPNGLRAAWMMAPERSSYVFGDRVSAHLKIWNTGEETLIVGNGTDGPGLRPRMVFSALGEGGREIGVESDTPDNVNFIAKWRLAPGEVATLGGYSMKIGDGDARETSFRPKYSTGLKLAGLRSGEQIELSASVDYPKAPGDPRSYPALQTGVLKFDAIAAEQVAVWATNRAGTWPMAGGAKLKIYGETIHAADVSTTAILTWPADGESPARHWFTWVASDAFANREPWAVAWERDKSTMWIAARSIGGAGESADGRPVANRLKRIDFSDPKRILEQSFTGWPTDGGPSAELKEKMSTLMEVRADGASSSVIHSWAVEGSPGRINLASVQHIHIKADGGGSFTVKLDSERTCGVETLSDTLRELIGEWNSKRLEGLRGGVPTQRVTIVAPGSSSAESLAKIVEACVAAGCGPHTVTSAPTVRGLDLTGVARHPASPGSPHALDLTDLYEETGDPADGWRQLPSVFDMPLPGDPNGTWVKILAGGDQFYLEMPTVATYGPISGDAVEMLQLRRLIPSYLGGRPAAEQEMKIQRFPWLKPLIEEQERLDRPVAEPVTDGTYWAQVFGGRGKDQIVILTKRGFTVSADATALAGAITLPVNTSAKTKTIAYSWEGPGSGSVGLKVGGYAAARFDLSRGRLFFVHFGKLEFSAEVFQVPADVEWPVISSAEDLTRAAASVSAWYAASDDRALWERSRAIVGGRAVKSGKALDAGAEGIVWGEPNEVGLRLGLGGLPAGAAVPIGQSLPVKQFIRNEGTETLRFSPTQVFNEGVDGELVRIGDGKKIPHQKGYRWQISFSRVRLAPGEYIELETGPLKLIMAEKDGSGRGGMAMLEHGFTVLPGEYNMQLTHGIGQFLGRPVNSNFTNPDNAPGVGEWTGVLASAVVPLHLIDPQVKTAGPGQSEEFGRSHKLEFETGAIKLRQYIGNPRASGGPQWEAESRDWIPGGEDGSYLVAWEIGDEDLWVKDAAGITHLAVEKNLVEAGHWGLDQVAGDLGSMPAGVRVALGLPGAPSRQAFDFTRLPSTPAPAKIDGDYFQMSLPSADGGRSPEIVLKVPHGRREFYIESGGRAYGPAQGNPVVELGLTELLRAELAETPNTLGLARLEAMIVNGRGTIRDCAFRLLGGLREPQAPFAYESLFSSMVRANIDDRQGEKALSAEARTSATYFWNLFHQSRRDWERTRPLLPADRYQEGGDLSNTPGIVWTPGADGVSIGVSGLEDGSRLEIGQSMPIEVYLRNDRSSEIFLSVPDGHNPVLQISLVDSRGVRHDAIYAYSTGLIEFRHRRLEPGSGIRVASLELESYVTAEAAKKAGHEEGEAHHPRLSAPVGKYELHLEYRTNLDEPAQPAPDTEWTGKLVAPPITIELVEPVKGGAAAPTIRGLELEGFAVEHLRTNLADLYMPDPAQPGEFLRKPGLFEMSLGSVGPWVLYRAGSDHFYLEVRPDPALVEDDIYGPIPGHPAERLDLAAWLQDSTQQRDPGYGRRVARDMIRSGDSRLTQLALDWIGEFPRPSPPDQHELWIVAMEEFLRENPASAMAADISAGLAKLRNAEAVAAADWEAKRQALPDESYSPGEAIGVDELAIVWGEAAENGLQLGIGGVKPGSQWQVGNSVSFDVYVRNTGGEAVRFAWTPRHDDGLSANLIGPGGERWQGSIVIYSALLFYSRCELEPGQVLALKRNTQFQLVRLNEDGTAPDKPQGNRFLVGGLGECQLEIRGHLGVDDWVDSRGEAHPRPAGEWSGRLDGKPIPVTLIGEQAVREPKPLRISG